MIVINGFLVVDIIMKLSLIDSGSPLMKNTKANVNGKQKAVEKFNLKKMDFLLVLIFILKQKPWFQR